jgi:hypothetical protein
MTDQEVYETFSEAYIIEKTVMVVEYSEDDNLTVKIEALYNVHSNRYEIRSYKKDTFTLQPSYPWTDGKYDRKPGEYEVWVRYDLPSVDADDADGAIRQALLFLSQRLNKI